jgi:hypothetical protein
MGKMEKGPLYGGHFLNVRIFVYIGRGVKG